MISELPWQGNDTVTFSIATVFLSSWSVFFRNHFKELVPPIAASKKANWSLNIQILWEGFGNILEQSFKGQINQKIDILSFVALPSPNAKMNYPKWYLGKDFSSQAFIER